MKQIIFLLLSLFLSGSLLAQDRIFGIKGGLTIGTQKWNSVERDALFAYNGSVFVEFMTEKKASIFMETGYHQKGSSFRSTSVSINDYDPRIIRYNQKFHNISLIIGMKARYELSDKMNSYYYLGPRLDVTAAYRITSSWSNYVNRVNYGVTAGGGIEFLIGDNSAIFLDMAISPDLSKQIYSPPFQWTDRDGIQRNFPEQKVINIPFELTIGYRFRRVIEWEE